MKKNNIHDYKSIKLFVSNYGEKTLIADFKKNLHDSYKLMSFLNGELKSIYNGMPEKTYYYLLVISKDNSEKRLIATYNNLPIGLQSEVLF